jgi:hypothetical protein
MFIIPCPRERSDVTFSILWRYILEEQMYLRARLNQNSGVGHKCRRLVGHNCGQCGYILIALLKGCLCYIGKLDVWF